MYDITFIDTVHGVSEMGFETFDEAMEYWNDYADTPSCVFGEMVEQETGEVIWHFNERGSE